ncbi:hypothetical protein ILUMI_08956 [Ignelater luminosus]|uniref:Uncharacterized protein n=1 Tax=Ignelater luminosus TaxID=2038154 RepID=A0A8K0D0Y1_IGNLU|nr:hypothetical protein ILUMI_08956 [Ignelater luminosus]
MGSSETTLTTGYSYESGHERAVRLRRDQLCVCESHGDKRRSNGDNELELKVSIQKAAKEIRFHESTLSERLKRGQETKKLGRYRTTFAEDQEKQLIQHCIDLDKSSTGQTEVSKTVAAKQDQTVTLVCTMSAVDHYKHFFFIVTRRRFNRLLIKDDPVGCDMAVADEGSETAKVTFEKAVTVEIITRGFKVADIYPFDRNVFTDADFIPSQDTDQDLQEESNEENQNDHRQTQCPQVDELSVAPEEIFSPRNSPSNSSMYVPNDVQSTTSCLSSAIQPSTSTTTPTSET